MHSRSIFFGNSYYNVTKNSLSAVCINFDPYDILVLNASFSSCFRSQMNMTLCNNHTLTEFNFSGRAYYLTGA